MKYNEYFLYGFWQKNNSDIFYFYGVKIKNALNLIIIGVAPILLTLISIYFKANQFIYLFTVLSIIISPLIVNHLSHLKMWFSYNRCDKQVNSIYKGNEIPNIINEEALPVNKKQFIERSGFREK